MLQTFNPIRNKVYKSLEFEITDFNKEEESQAYFACQFLLNDKKIIYRNAKITPKKVGQFVTFWKRNPSEVTIPFKDSDDFDYFVITTKRKNNLGQFVFPKAVLIQKGIISTAKKEGKRGFRVYPIWDITKSKQAIKTQEWQLDYFYKINDTTDLEKVKSLFL